VLSEMDVPAASKMLGPSVHKEIAMALKPALQSVL